MRAIADTADPALTQLYEQHAPALLAFLTRFAHGDRPRAEDLLQETILRAWRHPESRRPDGSWIVPWLFATARNVAIDQFRALAVRPKEVGDDNLAERVQVEDDVIKVLDAAMVRAAVEALPDRFREVLVELYLRDRSVAETAAKLGVPPGTVKSRAHYALKAMHQTLYREEPIG